MQLHLHIVPGIEDASLLVTSKKYYRQKPQRIKDAENRNLPIYVLRGNTPAQVRQLLSSLYPVEVTERDNSFKSALDEAKEAVEAVKNGQESVELSPQSAYIRRLQHLVAERNGLFSQSTGKDPNRRVRIFRT
jgi:hypothetical protein